MTINQQRELLTLPPVAGLPSREALAAWLELEAALISATHPGTDERKRLRLAMIAARRSDNEHVTSARRIARALRDPDASLADILVRVRSARHFRAVVQRTISNLMGEVRLRSYRKEYNDSMPPPQEGQPDFEVERATDENALGASSGPRYDGPPVESVIDTSDPAWVVGGPGEPSEPVRTEEGVFEVPLSVIRHGRHQGERHPTSLVVNIRGCSGAGKTTLVRALMERCGPAVPIERPGMKRYEGYQLPGGVRIVGDYRRVCGGAEGMKDEQIERVVREYAGCGNVVFEGLFISNSVGRWRRLACDLGNVIFAFLRPPLPYCIERIHKRRLATGTTKPFDEGRMKENWRRLPSHFRHFAAAGAQCVWLPWADPLPELETLLGLNDAWRQKIADTCEEVAEAEALDAAAARGTAA